MELNDASSYAIKHMMTRPRRTLLSILGIVIGVVAIVVILSVSEGFERDLKEQLDAFGPDLMMVVPVAAAEEAIGGSFAKPPTTGKIFQEDVDDINSIDGVKRTSRNLYLRASLEFKDKKVSSTVYGVDREIFEQYEGYLEIESGRFYKNGETKVAVLGADATTEIFGKNKVEVGSVIKIKEKNYRVVGILKKIGSAFSQSDDLAIFVPFDDGKEIFKERISKDEVGYVIVQIEEGYDAESVKEAIEEELAINRGGDADEQDFSVVTSEQVMSVVGNILFASQVVLGAVTLIAGVVGAIGIANTMFVNVVERVREIGILKALGATKEDILTLFITESVMISLAGGLIGLLVSYVSLELLQRFLGVPVVVSIGIVTFVFVFSFLTGVLAGIFPAYRAAKMIPVNSLRRI